MPLQSGTTSYTPWGAFFNGNPCVVNFAGTALPAGYEYLAKVYLVNGFSGSISGEPFAILTGRANAEGTVKVYLSGLFDNAPQLSPAPPLFKELNIALSDNHVRFIKIKFGLYYQGELQGSESTTAAYPIFYGGIDPYDFLKVGQGFFEQYYFDTKAWLTWQPDNKVIDPYQHEYLYYFNNLSPQPSSLRLWINVTYTDGTKYEYNPLSVSSPVELGVYAIPVGFANLGMDSLPKYVASYTVTLTDQNGQVLAATRTYRMDYKPYANPVYLLYRNSLGGYDTLRTIGDDVETFKSSYESADVSLPSNYTYRTRERIETKASGYTELQIPTGYLPPQWLKYLKEVQLSRDIYRITNDSYVGLSHLDSGELETYNKGKREEYALLKLRHQYTENYHSRLTTV